MIALPDSTPTSSVLNRVWHDFVRSRWGMLAYLILVFVATVLVLKQSPGSEWARLFTSLFTVVGLFTFARQIQRDALDAETSKASGTAFNATTAFRARILTALLMTALPLVGQTLALLQLRVPPHELPGLLLETALPYSASYVLFALLASFSASMAVFVVTLIAMTIVAVGLGSLTTWLGWPPPGPDYSVRNTAGLVTTSALVLVGALLLLHQYLTRNRIRGALLGLALFASLGFVAFPFRHSGVAQSTNIVLPDSLRPVEVSLDAGYGAHSRAQPRSQGWLDLVTQPVIARPAASATSFRHILQIHDVRLVQSDGSSQRVTPAERSIVTFDPELQLDSATHWIVPLDSAAKARIRFVTARGMRFLVTPSQRELLVSGEATLEISGDLEVLAPRPFKLPHRQGATFSAPGMRSYVTHAAQIEAGEAIGFMTIGLGAVNDFLFANRGWYRFYLLNTRRSEAVELYNMSVSRGNGGALLPLLRTSTHKVSLFVEDERNYDALRQGAGDWSRDADLVVVDWTSLGSYPITIQSPMQLRGSR